MRPDRSRSPRAGRRTPSPASAPGFRKSSPARPRSSSAGRSRPPSRKKSGGGAASAAASKRGKRSGRSASPARSSLRDRVATHQVTARRMASELASTHRAVLCAESDWQAVIPGAARNAVPRGLWEGVTSSQERRRRAASQRRAASGWAVSAGAWWRPGAAKGQGEGQGEGQGWRW